ncbi:MAG: heavy-metal-associated domain-containing protein [Chromatiaceae bacterium]|jgi:copper chaperone CopZ
MIEIQVTGMSCQHCVAAVTRALESVPGVTGVRVDLESGLARVQGEAEAAALERAVIDAGYGVGGSTGDAP